MPKIISCRALAQFLNETYQPVVPFTQKEVRCLCEAFGREVFCYIPRLSERLNVNRRKLSNDLKAKGWRGDDETWDSRNMNDACIRVTYFKAWHHNE